MGVQHISSADELKALLTTRTGLVVIDFAAAWCGPCKAIAPVLDQLSRKYETTTFTKVDVDELSEVAQAFKVSAMPTFVFMKGGKEVRRIQGADPSALEAAVKELGQVAFEGAGHRLGDASPAAPRASAAATAAPAAVQAAWPLEVNAGEQGGKLLLQQPDGSRAPYAIAPARHTVRDVYRAVATLLGHGSFTLNLREGMKPVELQRDDARTCAESKVAGGCVLLKLL